MSAQNELDDCRTIHFHALHNQAYNRTAPFFLCHPAVQSEQTREVLDTKWCLFLDFLQDLEW